MTPDDRRPFRGAPFERGRSDRPPGADHGDRPMTGDRPPFSTGAPRPFARPVTRGGDIPALPHTVRLRDGDRELEVSGAPAFVRQILDDLPALLGRLRGEAAGRTAISMPPPPATTPVVQRSQLIDAPVPALAPSASAPAASAPAASAPSASAPPASAPASAPAAAANGRARKTANARTTDAVEGEVFDVLRSSTRPLAISAIRQRMASAATGQQVRRILEKADTRVTVSAERPATYSLR
ncbi:MAG: hypothetical protein NVS3B18_09650 [Candidatus Dormibacteria bacterium]